MSVALHLQNQLEMKKHTSVALRLQNSLELKKGMSVVPAT